MHACSSKNFQWWWQRLFWVFILLPFLMTLRLVYDSSQRTRSDALTSLQEPPPTFVLPAIQATFFTGIPPTWQDESHFPFEEGLRDSTWSLLAGDTTYTSQSTTLTMSYVYAQYSSPFDATLQYLFWQPLPDPLADDHALAPHSHISVPPLSASAIHAHQVKAWCTSPRSDGCHTWYVLTRYGQYLVRIMLVSPAHPIDDDTLQALIATWDEYIAAVRYP